jgi:ubiquitin carboxyl-terminal hydrolase 25/28
MAEGRNSEQLKMRVGVLASSGELSYKSIMDSYKYFGLDPSRQGLTDDTIIGAFKARLEDSSKTQELDMREHLRIIGVSRSSDKIQSLANRCKQQAFDFRTSLTIFLALSSYSEALTWLDADQSTSDDFIVSLAGVKVPSN